MLNPSLILIRRSQARAQWENLKNGWARHLSPRLRLTQKSPSLGWLTAESWSCWSQCTWRVWWRPWTPGWQSHSCWKWPWNKSAYWVQLFMKKKMFFIRKCTITIRPRNFVSIFSILISIALAVIKSLPMLFSTCQNPNALYYDCSTPPLFRWDRTQNLWELRSW